MYEALQAFLKHYLISTVVIGAFLLLLVNLHAVAFPAVRTYTSFKLGF